MYITADMILKCLFSTVSCAAFAVQFNIRPKHLVCAAVGSFMSQFIFMLLDGAGAGETLCSFAAAAAAALYSEILARKMRVPANMYLITAIIPLVPGGMLYYTMSAFVIGDIDSALKLAVNTIGIAGAVAMGIFIVSSLYRLFKGKSPKKIYDKLMAGGKHEKSIKNMK